MRHVRRHRQIGDALEIREVDTGLMVRQGDESYIARNWKFTSAVKDLITAARDAGLGCMIRDDHPRRNARLPNTRGVVYIAFSPSSETQWSLAIDSFRPASGDFGVAIFNGKYQAQFLASGIPFTFEARNKGAGHLVVARQNVIPTVRALAGFDHSVLALNRTPHAGEGFTTEYVLQRQILTNWLKTPWAANHDVIQDEFPVDGGLTSRRIDILARDRTNGNWLVMELKRAEASVAAVHQVVGYLGALARRDGFVHGRLQGVLVAERFSQPVRTAAEAENIAIYEAQWPHTFRRM